MSPARFLLALLCLAMLLLDSPAAAAEAGKVDFNHQIRPILSAKCFHCHGPDEESREAGLRLDLREEAVKERDGIRAIVPGDEKLSELVLRIRSHDKDEVMPPPKEGESLTAQEIELVTRWVTQGAEYKEHWAWTKPVRSANPAESGGKNPIDAFIREKAAAAGLSPAPEADRHTLLRRLSLDLTGLPPTAQEVAEFVGDSSPEYYEKAVDRLLASAHFGEKWARMWLDLARYADSTGYGSDKFRLNIWPWRDWVIESFNRNVPYDQFSAEQLAGDLIAAAEESGHREALAGFHTERWIPRTKEERIAGTAFHRNTMTNVEGGTVDEEYRVAAVKDRLATTGQTWLGLTIGCAQCHTHKFDPISHTEYYQLYAIFNQTEDSDREDEAPTMPLPTSEQAQQIAALKAEIRQFQEQMKVSTPELEAEQKEWEAQMARLVEWKVLSPISAKGSGNVQLNAQEDGSVLASGENTGSDTYTVKVRSGLERIIAIRLELLPDATLPQNGPGRAGNGNAVLSELRMSVQPAEAKPVTARYLRIEAPGANRILSLAEVEIFALGQKARPRGGATQSSTAFDGEAQRALDGKTSGDYSKNSVTHTAEEANPWWEADFSADVPVEKLRIWNRTDGGLSSRLAPARIVLLDKDRKPVWEETITEAPAQNREWNLTGERTVALHQPSSDFSQSGFEIEHAVDGNDKTGWAFAPETGKPHAAVFLLKNPIESDGAEEMLTFTLKQDFGQQHTLGRFRIQATSQAEPVRELPPSIRSLLTTAPENRNAAQKEQVAAYFRPLSQSHAALHQKIAKLEKQLAGIKPVALPVLRELAGDLRRKTHLLDKGNYLTPRELVEPGLPAAFAPGVASRNGLDRLDLARWILSPENPLTARVAVNRVWAQLFGTGLVETEEDFGTQGALPSHPALLDWLAVTFQSRSQVNDAPALAWDMKALIKLIVTSATYRQSSRIEPHHLEKDPRNRLLTRYPRRRLDAEAVRDQALALSGLLARKIGGPSVYPPQPDGLWKVAFNGGQNGYPTSKGEDRYRRGIYTFWRRTMPYPSMSTFDAPSRESCTIRRIPTNTPLQAFVTLNDPCFVEAAQALARRIVREGGADASTRIKWALELTLARPASESQVHALQELLESELAVYRADPEAAKNLASSETQPLPADSEAAELAAWTVIANVLLNLDGVLMKS